MGSPSNSYQSSSTELVVKELVDLGEHLIGKIPGNGVHFDCYFSMGTEWNLDQHPES